MQCSNINKSLCHIWRLKRHSDVWVVSVKASCQLAWAAGKTHYVGRWNAACTLRYVAVAPGRPTSTCLFKIYYFYKILPRVGVVILNQKNLNFLFFNKKLYGRVEGLRKNLCEERFCFLRCTCSAAYFVSLSAPFIKMDVLWKYLTSWLILFPVVMRDINRGPIWLQDQVAPAPACQRGGLEE